MFDAGTFIMRLPSFNNSEAWSDGLAASFCAGIFMPSDMSMSSSSGLSRATATPSSSTFWTFISALLCLLFCIILLIDDSKVSMVNKQSLILEHFIREISHSNFSRSRIDSRHYHHSRLTHITHVLWPPDTSIPAVVPVLTALVVLRALLRYFVIQMRNQRTS